MHILLPTFPNYESYLHCVSQQEVEAFERSTKNVQQKQKNDTCVAKLLIPH